MVTTSQAIQAQIADLARDLNNQVKIQNTYRVTGTKGIQGAYGALDKDLIGLLKDTTNTVNQSRATVQSDYKRAGANITDAERSLREMLGNQGGLEYDKATGPLAEIKKINAERALAEADSLASEKLLGTGYITQATKARGDAKTEGAGQISSLTSQIGAEIGEMQRQYLKDKAAKQVEYAQALADERYKAEQLALERARLANEQAARRDAAARAAREDAKTKYEGKLGAITWMNENKIPLDQQKAVLAAIDAASQSERGSLDAYKNLQSAVEAHNRGGRFNPSTYYKGFLIGKKAQGTAGISSWNNMMLNNALDIMYGKYQGAGSE